MTPVSRTAPASAVIVGAGIVGLSTAWYLQERGVAVTVVDAGRAGSGASWGNAGWVVPGMVTPLAEPGAWKHAVESILRADAPLHIPLQADPGLLRFLARFSRNMTAARWQRTAQALARLCTQADQAFKELGHDGAVPAVTEAPYAVGFRRERDAEHFRAHLADLAGLGQPLSVGPAAEVPQFSPEVTASLTVLGQGYVDPGAFVQSLAAAVRSRGAVISEGWRAVTTAESPDGVQVVSAHGAALQADVLILASGASLPKLGRQWGLRVPLQAGRGYSFTVDADAPLTGPLYLPQERVVATPYQGGIRIAGTMEFRNADHPLENARVESIIAAASPMLRGIDWGSVRDIWVGSRPVTSDGLPVLGRLRSPRVFAAGGHGMWGVALGPVSGRLLAEYIVEGTGADELSPYAPLRR